MGPDLTTVEPEAETADGSRPAAPEVSAAPIDRGVGRVQRLRRPRVFLSIAAAVIVAGVALWWFVIRSDGASTAPVTLQEQVETVTSGPMSTTVSAEGTVAAAQTDDLAFTASGTVTAVNVKAGDTVVAGQVLATLDSAELEAAVASAESTLANAEATLSDDEAAGASDEQIAADEASVTSAEDALASAQENLDAASLVATFDGTVASVDLSVGEVLGSSGAGGTDATGSASGSGQSASSLGSASTGLPGATDTADESSTGVQIQVVSTGRYQVELAVGSDDVDAVAIGQEVTLTLSTSSSGAGGFPGGFPGGGAGGFPGGFPGGGGAATDDDSDSSTGSGDTPSTGDDAAGGATATGTVTEVSTIADASSGVATYPVVITFAADPTEFYVGATVSGAIETNTRDDVVQVSSRAVTTTNGSSTVVVATDGTTDGPTETRTVETGITANGNTEITEGLAAGEKVIVQVPGFGGGNVELPGGGGPGGFELPEGFQPPAGAGGPGQ